jgi:hypothetical protein
VSKERVGQVVGAADPLHAALGRDDDFKEGVAGQAGQLHASGLDRSGSTPANNALSSYRRFMTVADSMPLPREAQSADRACT